MNDKINRIAEWFGFRELPSQKTKKLEECFERLDSDSKMEKSEVKLFGDSKTQLFRVQNILCTQLQPEDNGSLQDWFINLM